MTRHPDAGVLAGFREGLLGRRRSARIRAHLSGCPRCASLDAGLAEVTTLLASSPAPSMPDHLAARLDSALAAEAARARPAGDAAPAGAGNGAASPLAAGAAAQADGQPGPSRGSGRGWRRTRHPARPSRPARGRLRVLGTAAAALIVLGGTAYGLASLGQPSGGPAASSGSGAGASGPAASQPGGPGPGTGAGNQPAASGGYSGTTTLHVIRSGTDYQRGSLASQAGKALASYGTGHAGPAQGTFAPAISPRLRACVTQITGGPHPRLVDVARYQGEPATIIVTASSAGHPSQVWVAGPGCSSGHSDVLAHTSLLSPG